jgi:hypothetical protein
MDSRTSFLAQDPDERIVRWGWVFWIAWLAVGGALLLGDYRSGVVGLGAVLAAPFWALWLLWLVYRLARAGVRSLRRLNVDDGLHYEFDGHPIRIEFDGDAIRRPMYSRRSAPSAMLAIRNGCGKSRAAMAWRHRLLQGSSAFPKEGSPRGSTAAPVVPRPSSLAGSSSRSSLRTAVGGNSRGLPRTATEPRRAGRLVGGIMRCCPGKVS